MGSASGRITSATVTSGGVLRGGDDIQVDLSVENTDSEPINYNAHLEYGGVKTNTLNGLAPGPITSPDFPPGSSDSATLAGDYDFTVWRSVDWSGVPANGTKTVPVTVVVEFWKGSNANTNRVSQRAGSVELYNEAEDEYGFSASVSPTTLGLNDTLTGTATVTNNLGSSRTFAVRMSGGSERSGNPSQTVTVPAGSSRDVTITTTPGRMGIDTPDSPNQIQVELYDGSVGGSPLEIQSTTISFTPPGGGGGGEPPEPSPANVQLESCSVTDSPPEGVESPAAAVTIQNTNTQPVTVDLEWFARGEVVASTSQQVGGVGSVAVYAGIDTSGLEPGEYDVTVRAAVDGEPI